MAEKLPTVKRVATVLVVALLVSTAGCSGLLGDDPATNTTTTTTPPTTITTTDTTQSTDTTTTETAPTTTTSDDDERSVAASGEMAVVIDDTRLNLADAATDSDASFWFDDATSSGEWQRNSTSVTLAAALETVGVNATESTATYQGETYREDATDTTVAIRVNGEPVDPTEYELQDGDQVWVLALTKPIDQSIPGEHISHDELHVHGDISMTVAGESVDFTRDKYQNPSHAAYFHFEGGEPHWHSHSWSVSLAYAMNTLPGINITADSVTYNNTTYDRSDPGTSITISVNGEPVDPSTYLLKDGDDVTITVTTDDTDSETVAVERDTGH